MVSLPDFAQIIHIVLGIFDWNDQSWVTSDSHVVKPNNTITASVWYIDSSNSYGMEVGCVEDGWSVKTYKKIKAPQIEATAYFVLEHAPMTCEAYPTDGEFPSLWVWAISLIALASRACRRNVI